MEDWPRTEIKDKTKNYLRKTQIKRKKYVYLKETIAKNQLP